MKNNKVKLWAKWDMVFLEKVVNERLGGRTTKKNDAEVNSCYEGTYLPLYLSDRVSGSQIWSVFFDVYVLDGDKVFNIEFEYNFKEYMRMGDILKPKRKINCQNGDEWLGAAKAISDEAMMNYPSGEVIKAEVTATCESKVKPTTAKENFFRMMKNV